MVWLMQAYSPTSPAYSPTSPVSSFLDSRGLSLPYMCICVTSGFSEKGQPGFIFGIQACLRLSPTTITHAEAPF